MEFPVITKSNSLLILLCIITKLSPILTFSFCNENSMQTSCNCSTIMNMDQMEKKYKCSLTPKVYNISDAETDAVLTIEVKQTNFSEQINIRCYNLRDYKKFKILLPTVQLGNVEDVTIESCPIKEVNSDLSTVMQFTLGVTNYEKLFYAIVYPFYFYARKIQFYTLKLRERTSSLQNPLLDIFYDPESFSKLESGIHIFNTDVDIDAFFNKLNDSIRPIRFVLQIDSSLPSNILLTSYDFVHVLGTMEDFPEIYVNEQESPSRLPSRLLSNMPDLQTVYITSFLSIPEDLFANSTNIQRIHIRYCNIESFPSNLIDNQHNLTVLAVFHSKLKYLPKDLLKGAYNLEELHLIYNVMSNFSSIIFQHTPNLRRLELEHSGLTAQNIEFEKSFANHSALRHINLNNNRITHIPKDWHIPCHLERLNIRHNQIYILSAADLKHLISDRLNLDLSYNNIIAVNFKNLEDVRQLSNTNITTNLEHNPIHCDCDLLNFILYLRGDIGEYIWNNIKFKTNYLSCDAPNNLKDKLLETFQMNCYKDNDAELAVHPLDLICPLHPSVCPSNCNCWRRDHDRRVVVNCSNIGLETVPKLPVLGLDDLTGIKPHSEYHPMYNVQQIGTNLSESPELTGIELYLENNQLLKLAFSSTPGYANVTKLYLSGNNITQIEKSQLPMNLTYLDLRRNRITSISNSTLKYLNENNLMQQLFLSENPWRCECNNESLDFVRFAIKNYRLVNDSQEMICHNTQNYFFEQQDLCSRNLIINKINDFNIILGIVCTIGLLLGSLIGLYYKYQRELKIWLFAHNWCLWFVTEEELDQDKIYDAFVSYSSKDERYVGEFLVPKLEKGSPSFKLCVYGRDWLVGSFIPDEIIRSVENSKRTIVVLSENFIKSIWARMEFKAAHQSALNEGRAKLIIIMYGDVEINENLDEDLRAYLKINIYLKWDDPQFWNKLLFAMPHLNTKKSNELEYIQLQKS